MSRLQLWRSAGSAASYLAPGLLACAQLLERTEAAAAVAPRAQTYCAQVVGPVGPRCPAGAAAGASSVAGGDGSAPAPAVAVAVRKGQAGLTGSTSGNGSSSSGSAGGSIGSSAGNGAGGSGGGAGGGSRGGGGAAGGRGSGWNWGRWRAWGGGASASSSAAAAAAVAAAGVVAAGYVSPGVALALAEAPSEPLLEALAATKLALNSAWGEVEEEFARINARLPSHAPTLKGEAPSASLVHGAVEVVVPLREGADADAVLREMRQGLGGRGSVSYSESIYGASRTVQLEVRPEPGRPESALRMQMFIPPPGGSEQAQVVISKRSAFTPDELAALGRLVRAANVTFSTDRPARGTSARRHGLHGGADVDALNRELEEVFSELARGAIGGFIGGPMRQLFEELQRGSEQPQGERDDDEDEDEGGYTGGRFLPPHPALGGGGFPGMPQSPVQRPKGRGASSAQGHDWGSPAAARAVEELLAMGAQVFPPGSKDKLDWGVLAGYEEQKRTIEDCLLLPLLRPDVYAKLARATRKTFASNRPRAVLFEGPPGTGKTTSARVISSQAAVPLIYLPLEAVLSKWYGQSEQQLGAVFKAAEAMGGAIIFLDELDALGGNRESGGMHEASRRLLSVLLREMEGFDSDTKRTVVIGATNRKTDLDPALLSRFDLVLTFDLPDTTCRQLILRQYAQQLSDSELVQLAERTPGMSGRDLRDVCEHTERRWASKIIRGEVREEALPPLSEYLASAEERASAVQQVQHQAASAGAINRLLGAGRSLPSWLTGGQ